MGTAAAARTRVQAALKDLQPIAKRNGMTLAQLALCWLIEQPLVCAIAGARNAQQVLQNAQTAGFELNDASRQAIAEIGSRVTDHLDYQDGQYWKPQELFLRLSIPEDLQFRIR